MAGRPGDGGLRVALRPDRCVLSALPILETGLYIRGWLGHAPAGCRVAAGLSNRGGPAKPALPPDACGLRGATDGSPLRRLPGLAVLPGAVLRISRRGQVMLY